MKPKFNTSHFAVLSAIVLTGASCASAATWNVDGAGSWNTAGSWSGGVPNGVGGVAEFSFNITANRSITLDGDKTVGDLKIGDPTPTGTTYHSYTLGAGTPATSRLIFDQTGLAAAKLTYPVTAATVANTISAPVLLNDDLEITSDVIATTNPSQSLSGVITDGSGSFSITKKGLGLITLGAANSYDGGTFVTGGKITASSNLSFGGGAVTVSSGTQVSLASTGAYPNPFSIAGNGVSLGTAETSSTNLIGALRYANSITTGTITVDAAGAKIGALSAAYGILAGPLAGTGNLDINGNTNAAHNGNFWLAGDASAYTGTITVTQGSLRLATSALGGSLVAKDGTTLVLNNALSTDTAPVIGTVSTPKSLTLGNSGSTTTGVSLYVDPSTSNPPLVNGDVTLNGINTVYLTNACAGTTSTILTYTGTLTGSVSNLALQTAAGTYRGASFNVDETSSPRKITLTMVSNDLVWSGAANTTWDTSANNWSIGTFLNGDNVTFDDSATGTGAVTVAIPTAGVVAPNKISVNNPTRDYTINGAGKIAGAAALTKDGAGKLTIANTTANTFTGGVTLKKGTLQVLPAATLGSPAFFNMSGGAFSSSSTGALSLATNAVISGSVTLGDGTNWGTVTFTGSHSFANNTSISVPIKGTVVFTGSNQLPENLTVSTPFSGSSNANLTLGGANILTADTTITNTGVYNSINALTLSGPLTDGASSFSLTKEGIGRLTLSAANAYDGGTVIKEGLIYFNNALGLGAGAVTVENGAQALFGGTGVVPNSFSITGTGMALPGLNNTSPDGEINLNTSGQVLAGSITLTGDARIGGYFSTSATISGVIGEDGNGPWVLDLGSPGAVNGSGTMIVTNSNTYGGGTNIFRTAVRATANQSLGSGPVTVSSGDSSLTKAIATRLEVGADVSLANDLDLTSDVRTNATLATQTWGVVTAYPGDANTPSVVTLSGDVNISKTPANGGHFAVQGNAANVLKVTGEISSLVPVIVSNGIVELGGGGVNYIELQQWKDRVKLAANDGISISAVVAQGATGVSVLDLNGFDQTLEGITRPTGANEVSVTNDSTTTASKLTLAPSAPFTYPGKFVTGASSLNLSIGGSSATTLSGNSTSYSGTTTVTNGGILDLTGTLGGTASSLVTQSGSTLRGKGTFGGNVTLGGGTTIDVNPSVAGNLTAGGDITVSGPVTVNLTNPPTGPVVVMSCTGTLTASAGNFTASGYPGASFTVVGKQVLVSVSSEPLTWTGTGGNTWNLNTTANWTDGSVARKFLNGFGANFTDGPGADQNIQVPGTVQPSSMTFGNSDYSYTFTDSSSGLIQAGSLTKNGAGRVTFDVPVTFAGTLTLNAGTVAVRTQDYASLPALSSALTGSGTLAVEAGYSGPVTISGANGSFGGVLAVTRGEMIVATTAAGGAGQIAIGEATTDPLDEPQLTLESGVSIGNAVVASSPANLSKITGTGAITGSGSLLMDGPGALEVATENSYSGPTTIVSGTLKGAVVNAIPATSTITMGTAASGSAETVLYLPPATTNFQTTLSAPLVLGAAPSSTAVLRKNLGTSAAYAGTVNLNGRDLHVKSSGIRFDGLISGTGAMVVDTNDVSTPVILNASGNTFTGGVSVVSGVMRASGGAAIPDTSSVALAGTGIFSLGANETVNAVTGASSSSIQAGAYSLTVGAGGSSFAFDGNWQSGTLVKTGAGVMSLNGACTSTGYLDIQGGTVLVNQSSAARIDVQSGGTIGGTGSVYFDSLPSGGHIPFYGFIEPGNQGVGTFTISNPLAFFGNAGMKLQIADWNSTTPGTGHDVLVCPKVTFGGGQFIVNLDCAGLANFTDEERSFTIVQGSETLYPPGFNVVTFNVTNFPGSGTWKLGKAGVYDNTLKLYYTPAAGYSSWASSKNLNSGNNGPLQDPDNDGIPNLQEYYLAGNPLAGDASILPKLSKDATHVILEFNRLDMAETDVTTQVIDYGSDLSNWPGVSNVVAAEGTTTDGEGVIVIVAENGADPDDITVKIPRSKEQDGRLFGRLRIVKP